MKRPFKKEEMSEGLPKLRPSSVRKVTKAVKPRPLSDLKQMLEQIEKSQLKCETASTLAAGTSTKMIHIETQSKSTDVKSLHSSLEEEKKGIHEEGFHEDSSLGDIRTDYSMAKYIRKDDSTAKTADRTAEDAANLDHESNLGSGFNTMDVAGEEAVVLEETCELELNCESHIASSDLKRLEPDRNEQQERADKIEEVPGDDTSTDPAAVMVTVEISKEEAEVTQQLYREVDESPRDDISDDPAAVTATLRISKEEAEISITEQVDKDVEQSPGDTSTDITAVTTTPEISKKEYVTIHQMKADESHGGTSCAPAAVIMSQEIPKKEAETIPQIELEKSPGDTSTDPAAVNMAAKKLNTKEAEIIRQIEYYFGDVNLPRDTFLLKLMEADNGWVTVKAMITFRRLAYLTTDIDEIIFALKKSDSGLLEIDSEKYKIRRSPHLPLPEWDETELNARTAVVRGFPQNATFSRLLMFFNQRAPAVEHIQMVLQPKAKGGRVFTGTVEALFKTMIDCENFINRDGIRYCGKTLTKTWKDSVEEKRENDKKKATNEQTRSNIRSTSYWEGTDNNLENEEGKILDDGVVKFNCSKIKGETLKVDKPFFDIESINPMHDLERRLQAEGTPLEREAVAKGSARPTRGSLFGIFDRTRGLAAGTPNLNAEPVSIRKLPPFPREKATPDVQQPPEEGIAIVPYKPRKVRIAAKLQRPLLYPALYTEPQPSSGSYFCQQMLLGNPPEIVYAYSKLPTTIYAGDLEAGSKLSSSPFSCPDSSLSLRATYRSSACYYKSAALAIPKAIDDPISAKTHATTKAIDDPISAQTHASPKAIDDPISAQTHASPKAIDDPISAQTHATTKAIDDPISAQTHATTKAIDDPVSAQTLAIPKAIDDNCPTHEKAEKEYFDSYARFSIHQSMIKDQVRTNTFRNAIAWNKHLFQGKVVLDVGCGTGILSMFTAKAGARKVIGIEKSDIADFAQEIVSANGFSDTITIIKGKVEEVELPFDLHEVDVIISEWMGYCLFFENMLPTVLYARDKWLKPGGVLLPDRVSLHIAAIEHDEGKKRDRHLSYWCDVYGFSMEAMMEAAFTIPITTVVPAWKLVSNTAMLVELDLNTCTMADVEFNSTFRLQIVRDARVQALVTYFNVEFTSCHTYRWFSTSPEQPLTHWKQTVFFLREHSYMEKGDEYDGIFNLKLNRWHRRHLDIHLELSLKDEFLDGRYRDTVTSHVNDYNMQC